MIKNLYWFSWLIFLVSASAIIVGGLILLKTGKDIGLFVAYAGFMGFAVSGFLMATMSGVPKGG